MNAKDIIKELLARFPEPECREQEAAIEAAKQYIRYHDHMGNEFGPRTQAAIEDCFQSGLHYKVKANAMQELEREMMEERE